MSRLTPSRLRSAVILFFFFMLLHQTDKLLIGPLTPDIIDTFGISYTEMGAVTTGALFVGAILYPIWGYLFDRYARNRLLALASLIWGATTWLSAIAPTYPLFLASRSSTGIDDSSYPGMYSLVADYYPPTKRGKIYGLLQLAQPLGYLLGLVLALLLAGAIGWRSIYFITGSLGIVLAVAIYFGVSDVPRGEAEPELAGLDTTQFHFDRKIALGLLHKPSLILLFLQGFFGVFPWNTITYWIFTYLEKERGYTENTILLIMVPAILVLASGYPIGGILGDSFFKRNKRGRIYVAVTGVIVGALLLIVTLNIPVAQSTFFAISLMLTAIFMPLPAANVLATVSDVTEPEVRSTAVAILNFMEYGGSALAPLIAGIIADATNLQTAILSISTSTWALCAIFFFITAYKLPRDIDDLRLLLRRRAAAVTAQE